MHTAGHPVNIGNTQIITQLSILIILPNKYLNSLSHIML